MKLEELYLMINREERTNGSFVQVDKSFIDDNKLSAGAKGVLLYMLSKSDDWQFYETEICNHFSDSIKTIKKYIKELIDNKYIYRERKQKSDTKRFYYEYEIYETKDNEN
jgi:transcription initiation factor IIE alpha subunit